MTLDYLSKAAVLHALTSTHEQTVTSAMIGGSVLVRELTARQRQLANDAATAENPDAPDQVLFRAMLLHFSLVDPTTGTPGPDGTIDPRTRTPLLSIADALDVVDGRQAAVDELIVAITSLAALGPRAFKSAAPPSDALQRDAGAGTDADGSGTARNADAGTGHGNA
jgi:hypothetical protein